MIDPRERCLFSVVDINLLTGSGCYVSVLLLILKYKSEIQIHICLNANNYGPQKNKKQVLDATISEEEVCIFQNTVNFNLVIVKTLDKIDGNTVSTRSVSTIFLFISIFAVVNMGCVNSIGITELIFDLLLLYFKMFYLLKSLQFNVNFVPTISCC